LPPTFRLVRDARSMGRGVRQHPWPGTGGTVRCRCSPRTDAAAMSRPRTGHLKRTGGGASGVARRVFPISASGSSPGHWTPNARSTCARRTSTDPGIPRSTTRSRRASMWPQRKDFEREAVAGCHRPPRRRRALGRRVRVQPREPARWQPPSRLGRRRGRAPASAARKAPRTLADSPAQRQRARLWPLVAALYRCGTTRQWQERLGARPLREPIASPNRRVWTKPVIAARLTAFCVERGEWPPAVVVREARLWPVDSAASRYGGIPKSRRLGYDG